MERKAQKSRSRNQRIAPSPEPVLDLDRELEKIGENATAARGVVNRLARARKSGAIAAGAIRPLLTGLAELHQADPRALEHALAVVLDREDFDWTRGAVSVLRYVRAVVKRNAERRQRGLDFGRKRGRGDDDDDRRPELEVLNP